MALVKVEISFEFDLDAQSQTLEEAMGEFEEELKEEFDDTKKLKVFISKID